MHGGERTDTTHLWRNYQIPPGVCIRRGLLALGLPSIPSNENDQVRRMRTTKLRRHEFPWEERSFQGNPRDDIQRESEEVCDPAVDERQRCALCRGDFGVGQGESRRHAAAIPEACMRNRCVSILSKQSGQTIGGITS